MKVLIFYTQRFAYTTATQNLPDEALAECDPDGATFSQQDNHEECLTAFIHIEKEDEQYTLTSREKKLANHLKWVARKNDAHRIVLHSFAHLSNSKAALPFTKDLLDATQVRLENGGYEVAQTPFGYFLNFRMDAPGAPTTRIWAEL